MGQFWKKLWTFMWSKVSQFVKTYMLRSRASDLWIGDKDQLSMMKYGKVSSGIKMDIHRNIKHYDSQPETTMNHPEKHSPVSISRLPYKCYIPPFVRHLAFIAWHPNQIIGQDILPTQTVIMLYFTNLINTKKIADIAFANGLAPTEAIPKQSR